MCLLFVFINPSPQNDEYKLILVNNRDEFYSRPTEPAKIWNTERKIIAGQDLMHGRAGGTWLGVSESGAVACLLNVYQPLTLFKDPSTVEGRGFLAVNYLLSGESAREYFNALTSSEKQYNSFNLVALEPFSSPSESNSFGSYRMLYYNNINKEIADFGPGVHGFGNSFLRKPFRKILRGESKLKAIVEKLGVSVAVEEDLISELFAMMQDKEPQWPDETLSEQGRGYPAEHVKALSSMCVTIPLADYGTRTTTVLLVDTKNRARFIERTMKEPIDYTRPQWVTSDHTLQLLQEPINEASGETSGGIFSSV